MKRQVATALLTGVVSAAMLAGCGSSTSTATTAAAGSTEASGSTAASTTAASADKSTYDGKSVNVWIADNVVDFTNEEIKKFQEAYPQYAGVTFTVEPVGEGDAASNVITDVESAADVYGFAQDQVARLVAAGAQLRLRDAAFPVAAGSGGSGADGGPGGGEGHLPFLAFPRMRRFPGGYGGQSGQG